MATWMDEVQEVAPVEPSLPAFFQVGSTEEGPGAATSPCQWMVHYDLWVPRFQPGQYRGPGQGGGSHCLEACCNDPTCLGLQLLSSEHSQCYKYAALPPDLKANRRDMRPLGDGRWLHHLPNTWSVFVKAGHHALPLPATDFVPSQLERARMATEAVGLKFGLKAKEPGAPRCNFTVHYDMWTNLFDPGEYEPNSEMGGSHCLDACCEDPSCHGLALESLEKYQCYKYSSLPGILQQGHGGRAPSSGRELGDGQWLRKLRPAWSIFVKRAVEVILPVPWLPLVAAGGPASQPPLALAAPAEAVVSAERYQGGERMNSETAAAGGQEMKAGAAGSSLPSTGALVVSSMRPAAFSHLALLTGLLILAVVLGSYAVTAGDLASRRAMAKVQRLGLEAHLAPEGEELLGRAGR